MMQPQIVCCWCSQRLPVHVAACPLQGTATPDEMWATWRSIQAQRCSTWFSNMQDWLDAGFTREEAFDLIMLEIAAGLQVSHEQRRAGRHADGGPN